MIETFFNILHHSYSLFIRMAPYLLFGFTIAGFLRIFLDTAKVSRLLGGNTFSNSVKAALFGVPLPLCSCSVIPAAMSLRKEGASEGSTLSFLISTPATGVDSVLTTYSLLGGIFAVYRVIASFLSGLLAGVMSMFISGAQSPVDPGDETCASCENRTAPEPGERTFLQKIKEAFSYAFGGLLAENGKPILTGVLIGGAISYFLPEELLSSYMGPGIVPILVMLVISIPMYVCANASVPIAAALMYRGLAPGAAFAFLLAGPATNVVTISVVARNLGKRALLVYLSSIVLSGIGLGLLLNRIFMIYDFDMATFAEPAHGMVPSWVGVISAVILLGLMAYNLFASRREKTV